MYVVRIWEGLGNQMFQYAFARAVYAGTGQKVYLDVNRTYKEKFEAESRHKERPFLLHHFNITLPELKVDDISMFDFLKQESGMQKVQYFLSKIGWHTVKILQDENNLSEYHREFFSQKGDFYAFGWFQQEEYFRTIRSALLKEFTPKEKIKLPHDLHGIMTQKTTVALHVRRGDYLKFGNVCNGYYYCKAMKYIEEKIENPIYIVFSDDTQWVKQNIKFTYPVIFISEDTSFQDYEELLIMSRCKHQIIANSTFSWWGAWLNRNPEKIVIAPQKWFGNQKNIVPQGWVKI